MNILNVDGIYNDNLPLTGEWFTVKSNELEIKVPLIFKPEIENFTEEMKKVNLRWVMICLKWVKYYKNLKKAEYISPLFKEYLPINAGVGAEWDILGVSDLKHEFPNIVGLSRIASRVWLNPGVPLTYMNEADWVNPSLMYDFNYGSEQKDMFVEPYLTCRGGRRAIGLSLESIFTTKDCTLTGTFGKYAELANLITDKSYLSKARDLIYDGFVSEDDMMWSRELAFVIVAKHDGGVFDSFNIFWVYDGAIDVRMKQHASRFYIDPHEPVKNALLFTYMVETSVHKNLELSILRFNNLVSDIASASYYHQANSGSVFNKSMIEHLTKEPSMSISNFVEFIEDHSDSRVATRLPIKKDSLFAGYINGRFVDAWFVRMTRGLSDFRLPQPVDKVYDEYSLVTALGDEKDDKIVSNATAYLPIPIEQRNSIRVEELLALNVIARYIGYSETVADRTSVKFEIDKRYRYAYINERLFDTATIEEINENWWGS